MTRKDKNEKKGRNLKIKDRKEITKLNIKELQSIRSVVTLIY
jgi:hypothetical protein